jgi:hypothetical protein
LTNGRQAWLNTPMMKTIGTSLLAFALFLSPHTHAAGLFDWLGLGKSSTTNTAAALPAALSSGDIASGLKEALGKGVERAVASLGKEDGFLKDVAVKIPMPEGLQKIERTLRTLRQDKLADEFVTTMNRAAEKAAPEAAAVLADSIKQMTFADAKSILTGTNNAATQYFRRTSETNLHQRFLPIVKKATEQAGVTSAYKQMVGKASFGGFSIGSVLGQDVTDLDGYVTRKALDGLFVKLGDEERRIRENPAARTSALLQKVFGSVSK